MAFSEVFTGLQTGTIDGQENPVEVPLANKLYEVQKYLSMTNHINDAFILALSDQKWSSLSADQQSILQAAADETAQYKTSYDEEQATKAVTELKAQGMQVNDLTPAGLAEFRQASKALYPKFSDLIGRNSSTRRSTLRRRARERPDPASKPAPAFGLARSPRIPSVQIGRP